MPNKQTIDDSNKEKYAIYGKNFKNAREKLNLTQEQIVEKSTILSNKQDVSRLENGKTEFWSSRLPHELVDLCKTYQISMDDAFNENPDLVSKVLNDYIISNDNLKASKLTTDTRSGYFTGYLGNFYCYFHSTAKENKVIKGKLEVKEGNNHNCIGILEIDLGHEDDKFEKGKVIKKEYCGEVIYSSQRKTVYFILKNEEIGEFVIMHCYQPDINNSTINECRMANVISASAGVGNRHPVMFNMLITSKELDENQIDEIKPSLLISSNYIILEKTDKIDIPKKVLDATSIRINKYKFLSVKKFSLDNFRDCGLFNYDEKTVYTYLLRALAASLNTDITIDLDEKIDLFLHKRLFE